MEILKCEGVTKVYDTGGGQVIALDHIDLSVEKGEFTAIIVGRPGDYRGDGYLIPESDTVRDFPPQKGGAGLPVL